MRNLMFKMSAFPLIIIILACSIQYSASTVFYQKIKPVYTDTYTPEYKPYYTPDSDAYIDTSKALIGEAELTPIVKYRLFAPLIPALALIFKDFIGYTSAYLFLNFLFLILASIYFYRFCCKLFIVNDSALCSTIMFITAMPVVTWGPCVLVEMGSWAVSAIVLFYTYSSGLRNGRQIILFSVLFAISVLTKPTLAFLVLFSCAYLFFVRKEYYTAIFAGLASSVMVLLVYYGMGLTLKDFTSFGYPRHQHTMLVVSSCVFAYHLLLPLFYFGVKGVRNSKTGVSEDSYRRIVTCLWIYLLCTFLGYLMFVHAVRLVFTTYLALIPLAVIGIEYIQNRYKLKNFLIKSTVAYVVASNVLTATYLSQILIPLGKQLVGMTAWDP